LSGFACLGLKFSLPGEEGETQIFLHGKWSGAPSDSLGISAGLLLQKYGFNAYILNFSKIFDTKGYDSTRFRKVGKLCLQLFPFFIFPGYLNGRKQIVLLPGGSAGPVAAFRLGMQPGACTLCLYRPHWLCGCGPARTAEVWRSPGPERSSRSLGSGAAARD
jgi:hypothetical protein